MCKIKFKKGNFGIILADGLLDVEHDSRQGEWGWESEELSAEETKALYEKMKEFYEGGKE